MQSLPHASTPNLSLRTQTLDGIVSSGAPMSTFKAVSGVSGLNAAWRVSRTLRMTNRCLLIVTVGILCGCAHKLRSPSVAESEFDAT